MKRACFHKFLTKLFSFISRYILKLAAENGGVVVSNDNYRDFVSETDFSTVIEQRLLMYAFVQNM